MASKTTHELRDPIHVFVNFSSDERRVIDSPPVQRLRHIHQLAMTYLVYPGATHRRFEHSLGVMELASRVYAVVTRRDRLGEGLPDLLPELANDDAVSYWRRVIRTAGLCHDLGHLPFSHAAERELLPDGWDHERLTSTLIPELGELLTRQEAGPIDPTDVVKLALGRKKLPETEFTRWETVLSEIIVGDAFGVDRMDYLLRDSHHVGEPYGRFDHYRLIDTLRLLPDSLGEPAVGIELGGLHSAEALLIARYFMYTQVYHHPVRMIYDIHLVDFLREWLDAGRFPTDPGDVLLMNDNVVLNAVADAARNPASPGHDVARRLTTRDHFKELYSRLRPDALIDADVVETVYRAAADRFGEAVMRRGTGLDTNKTIDFPVRTREGRIEQASNLSDVLQQLPVVATGYVFAEGEVLGEAKDWLAENRDRIIRPQEEE